MDSPYRKAEAALARELGNPSPTGEDLLRRAQLLRLLNRGDEARSALDSACDFEGTRAMAFCMIGFGEQAAGRFGEAKTAFEAAIRADGSLGEAYLGWTQSGRLGTDDEWLLESALKHESETEADSLSRMALHYSLAKMFDERGDLAECMRRYDLANDVAHRVNLEGRRFDLRSYAAFNQRLREILNRDVLQAGGQVVKEEPVPILVTGMMRSGTTLVDQILTRHSKVAGAGEVEFWLDHGAKAIDWSRGQVHLGLLPRFAAMYLETLVALAGRAPAITDKTPQHTQWLGLVRLAHPNAKVIHVRRDPLDTCLSIYTTPYEQSPEFAHDQAAIVAAYREYRTMMEHWLKALPASNLYEVEYEALVEDPEPTIHGLIDWCGLSWEENCLRPESSDGLILTPSVWQARQPINRNSVGRGQKYLPSLRELRSLSRTASS